MVFPTVLSQLNFFAWISPLALSFFCNLSSSKTSKIFSDIDFQYKGFSSRPTSSTTSFKELLLAVITGVPQAIASKGGSPNPS